MASQGGACQPLPSLTEHFKSHDPSQQGSAWNALWEEEFTPWDRGGPSWALYDLLTERPDLFESLPDDGISTGKATAKTEKGEERRRRRRKTALVPGCGRGHDVLLLSSLGYDVVGLDISARALEEARKNAAAVAQGDKRGKGEGDDDGEDIPRGSITWVSGDFFRDDWLRDAADGVGRGFGGKFDLIFDYTFLSALHPSMRPRWAERLRDLLAPGSSGGRLVCLEFPSRDPAAQGPGPAWALPPQTYAAHLARPGSPVPTDENGAVAAPAADYDPPPPREDGLVRLVHLRPRRTHPAGMASDGKEVQDRISVWKHCRASV